MTTDHLSTALDRVELSSTEWIAEALPIIREIAATQPEFTTDDLWRMIDPPMEPRALGAAMREARRSGWAEPTDRTRRSDRRECHHRPIRVWQSMIYEPLSTVFDELLARRQAGQDTEQPPLPTIFDEIAARGK